MKPFMRVLAATLLLLFSLEVNAQSLLDRPLNLQLSQVPLSDALEQIGRQGGFRFSYNSKLIPADSLVSLQANGISARQALDALLGRRLIYKEQGRHVILQQPAPGEWQLSGYVIHERTGERIAMASVYEPNQLVATLTNDAGYFSLKLRQEATAIHVSKSFFRDTAILLSGSPLEEMQLRISPQSYELDSFVLVDKQGLEDAWLWRLLLSSGQKVQSLNLAKFFVDKPYQFSLLPGIGTHGGFSSQVVNKFSLNVLGGYSAAVNGLELGGLFNIVQKDAHYVQLAGLFNLVGGSVEGLQAAGLINHVLGGSSGLQAAGLGSMAHDSVQGVQAAGLYNIAGGPLRGAQISGLFNLATAGAQGVQAAGLMNLSTRRLQGAQLAGLINLSARRQRGSQVAGLANVATGHMTGSQISSLLNIAGRIDGLQLGLVNVADTVSGLSLGLLNLVWRGHHRLVLAGSELLPYTVSVQTGNNNLYTIILAGMQPGNIQKAYTFGIGFGSALRLRGRWSLHPEATAQHLYLGRWDQQNLLGRLQLNLQYRLGRGVHLFAGPAASVYWSDGFIAEAGYMANPSGRGLAFDAGSRSFNGWLGWNAGLSLF